MSLPVFKVKHKIWNKIPVQMQQKMCEKYDIILEEPIPTKKERALNVLRKIDYTTPEGRKNIARGFEKFENGMQKFDKALDDFDKAWTKGFGPPPKKKKDPLDVKLPEFKIDI